MLEAQLNELSQRERVSSFIAAAAIVLIVWVHWNSVSHANSLGWLVCMFAVLLVRLGLSQKNSVFVSKRTDFIFLRNVRVLVNIFYGAGWGAIWFMLDTGQLDFLFMFKFAALAAMLGITVNSMGVVLPSYIGLATPVVLLSTFFLVRDTPYLQVDQRYSLLIGVAVYTALLVVAAQNLAKLTSISLKYRFERETALAESTESHQRERQLRERLQQESTETSALKNQLQSTLNAIPDLLFEVGLDGYIRGYHSPRIDMLNMHPGIFIDKLFSDALPPDMAAVFESAIAEADEKGFSIGKQYKLQLAHGTFWFELSVSRKPIIPGQEPRFILLARDITERKRAEEALKLSKVIIDSANDGFWMIDLSGHLLDVNQAYAKIVGYTREELVGMHIAQLSISTDTPDLVMATLKKAIAQTHLTFETRHRRKDGTVVDLEASLNYMAENHSLFCFHRDITERKLAEAKINHLAFHDSLTDLPNRILLNDRMQQALIAAKRDKGTVALMFLDLDKFKPINDTFGHEVGDKLLKEAAVRILACMRESDTVSRIGGDEFVVLLRTVENAQDALWVAEKIRFALSRPFELDGHELSISSSIGIALYPEHGSNGVELSRSADIAMYQAKKAGRNTVEIFIPDTQTDTMDEDNQAGKSVVSLIWKDSYASGEPLIDREHRKLFRLANILLAKAVMRNTQPDQFYAAFDALLNHVVEHFAHEESILAKLDYEHVSEHAAQHQALVESALKLRLQSEDSGVSIGELVEFLVSDVVSGHMLQVDQAYFGLFAGDKASTGDS